MCCYQQADHDVGVPLESVSEDSELIVPADLAVAACRLQRSTVSMHLLPSTATCCIERHCPFLHLGHSSVKANQPGSALQESPMDTTAPSEPGPRSAPLDLSILPMFEALLGSAMEQQQLPAPGDASPGVGGTVHLGHPASEPTASHVQPDSAGLEDQGQALEETLPPLPVEPPQEHLSSGGIPGTQTAISQANSRLIAAQGGDADQQAVGSSAPQPGESGPVSGQGLVAAISGVQEPIILQPLQRPGMDAQPKHGSVSHSQQTQT